MNLRVIYYAEVNLICIAVLLLIGSRLRRDSGLYSSNRIVFNALIWVTVVCCAADMAAGIVRGRIFTGCRAITELSNLIYLLSLAAIGLLWALYVRVKLYLLTDLSLKSVFWPSLPFLLFTLVALTNPFTHFIFSVSTSNLYVRGPGVYLHWAVTWLYLIVPTVRVAIAAAKAPNRMKRQELLPMLSFIVAPALASAAQMFHYGVTASQAGISLSIAAIFLLSQDEQILTDSLTGLNNRRGFDNYISEKLSRHLGEALTMVIIDINGFKQVNDRFGHIVGDKALVSAAGVLKRVSGDAPFRVFLCRYGGDEFLMCCSRLSREEERTLEAQIHSGFAALGGDPCKLSVSIGMAGGVFSDIQSAEALIRRADEAMYAEKGLFKQANSMQG